MSLQRSLLSRFSSVGRNSLFLTCTINFFSMHTNACLGNISWWHAVWKPLKHWGPAPTVPNCLYELVTHSATNASRSQSQARQHLCTSEHISVRLRVLELSREVALRTLATVRQSVGVLSGLTYRKEQHILLFTCLTVSACSGEVLSFLCSKALLLIHPPPLLGCHFTPRVPPRFLLITF